MKLKILGVAAVLAGLCGVVLMPSTAMAVTCPAGSLRGDSDKKEADSYAECNIPPEVDDEPSLMERVVDILNIVVGVVGIVAVAVVIIGGVLYVVSTGEPAKTQRAKNTILYGIVGLVISLLAFALVNFVLSTIFGKKSPDNGNNGNGDSSQETGDDDN